MGEAEWKKVIEECHTSGISIKSWCKQQGIKYSSYQYWARKIKNQSQRWAQVQQTLPETNTEIKILCKSILTIAVKDKVSLELLEDVLKVVNKL